MCLYLYAASRGLYIFVVNDYLITREWQGLAREGK